MPNAKGRPTLLVFTRGAERETRRRRLLPARLAPLELTLHRRCVEAALEAGRNAGCAIVVSSPNAIDSEADGHGTGVSGGSGQAPTRPDAATRLRRDGVVRVPQQGHDFGTRLRAAVRQAQDLSSGPLLVVGTDTPGLTADHLCAALDRLEGDPDSVVVGPAPDGGIYLLGSRHSLDRELTDVSWRHRQTIDSLLTALATAGRRVRLLEPLADLDHPQDLARWASRGGTTAWWSFIRIVREALAALGRLAPPPVLGRPRRRAVVLPSGRAPPSFS